MLKIFKPGIWLAGNTAASQSEALSTNVEFNMDLLNATGPRIVVKGVPGRTNSTISNMHSVRILLCHVIVR